MDGNRTITYRVLDENFDCELRPHVFRFGTFRGPAPRELRPTLYHFSWHRSNEYRSLGVRCIRWFTVVSDMAPEKCHEIQQAPIFGAFPEFETAEQSTVSLNIDVGTSRGGDAKGAESGLLMFEIVNQGRTKPVG
jgi:hypothetical protein